MEKPLTPDSFVDGVYDPNRTTIVRWGDHFFLQTPHGWDLVQAQDADGSGRSGDLGRINDA
jgi:hypothetical protein